MGSYQLDILPRCVEYLLKEDPVFIGKMEEILNVTIESQPEVSVRGLMARIVLELKNTAMKVRVCVVCFYWRCCICAKLLPVSCVL